MEARGLAMPLLPGEGDRRGARAEAAPTAAPTDGASASYYAMFMKAIHAGGLHGGIFHEEGPLTLLQCMERAAHECLALVDEALVRKGFSGRAYEDALGRALDTFNYWTDAMLGEETQRIVDAHPQIDTVLFRAVCATYVRHVHGDVLRASGQRASIRVPPFGSFVREFFRHLAADAYVRSAAYFDRARLAERKLVHADAVRAALDLCMRGNVTYVAAPPPATPSSATSASSPISSSSSSSTTSSSSSTSSSAPSTPSSSSTVSTPSASISSTPTSSSSTASAATPAPSRPPFAAVTAAIPANPLMPRSASSLALHNASARQSASSRAAPVPMSPLASLDTETFALRGPGATHAAARQHALVTDHGTRADAGALATDTRAARLHSAHDLPENAGMRHTPIGDRASRSSDAMDIRANTHHRAGPMRHHGRKMGPYEPSANGDDDVDEGEDEDDPPADPHRSFGLSHAGHGVNTVRGGNGTFNGVHRFTGAAHMTNDFGYHRGAESSGNGSGTSGDNGDGNDDDSATEHGAFGGGSRAAQPQAWGMRQHQARVKADYQPANAPQQQPSAASWNMLGRPEPSASLQPPHRPPWANAQRQQAAPHANGARRVGTRPVIRLVDQPAMPHYVPELLHATDNPVGDADANAHGAEWRSATTAPGLHGGYVGKDNNHLHNNLRDLGDPDGSDLDDDDNIDDSHHNNNNDNIDRGETNGIDNRHRLLQGDMDDGQWTE
ncbi:hypothetical protein pmac_cds_223 [Pandoravirus macleodensis]|uniref:Uncharacterized protein n=1 Tax=Pandoravirus macleodensis TaxID=2107707 RepID=A0A2U7UEL3_9VIRU|nr:hypothetical protein pmac_cds_223 [Pandoravirus macleodensis]AVK76911.1 hypothetical protein pmac_cds_223 [Pandoravirus macleodensis]